LHQATLEEFDNRTALHITETQRNYTGKTYEDTSFETGDSPKVLDIETDLTRTGREGYIINDGDGNFTVEFSADGTNYGSAATIKKDEQLNFSGLVISKIRLTWVSDSAYRVFII